MQALSILSSFSMYTSFLTRATVQIWVSPWQVAHLLSIIETIRMDIPASLAAVGSTADASVTAAQKAGASAMRTQLRIQASLEVPLISAICSVHPP